MRSRAQFSLERRVSGRIVPTPGSMSRSVIDFRLPAALLGALLAVPSAARTTDLSAADLAFFESKVRPVLSKACYECHAQDSKKIKGGLLLDRKAGWVKGGDSGEVIVPGKPVRVVLPGSYLQNMVSLGL